MFYFLCLLFYFLCLVVTLRVGVPTILDPYTHVGFKCAQSALIMLQVYLFVAHGLGGL